jgi:hypothetical protein
MKVATVVSREQTLIAFARVDSGQTSSFVAG